MENLTDLQAALRKACEDAAKYLPEPRGISDADVADIIERHLTPVVVAAAYARATNLIAQVRDDYHSNDGPFDMGMRLQMLENEVCSLTPADAARELERVKASSFLAGQAEELLRIGCRPELLNAALLSYVEERQKELSKTAPVERSNENG